MNQFTAPTKPQPFGGDRSAVMGADMMGHQDFSQHGGRSAPSYSEDTGAAMQPHKDQKLFEQQFSNRQPAAGQSYDQRRSPPYNPLPVIPKVASSMFLHLYIHPHVCYPLNHRWGTSCNIKNL